VERFQKLSSRAIIGRFFERLALAPKIELVDAISGAPYDSDQASEEYPWLGMTPVMREWIGGRQAKSLRESSLTIKNKKFEATLEILLDDIRRNKTAQLMTRVDELALRAEDSHWLSLLCTLILAGESTVCYDGDYFFGTAHAEGDSGTQANLVSIDISALATSVHGSTTNPSAGEMSLCIQRAVQTLMGLKDDHGEPFNETATQFKVVAGTNLLEPITAALSNQFISSGEQNTLVNNGKYQVTADFSARLTTLTTKFDVYRTDGAVKPFIRQEEVPLKTSMVAEGSELEFLHDKWEFGVMASRNVGVGLWQHACRISMT
jgi:phage major head subunit gpT-like protein